MAEERRIDTQNCSKIATDSWVEGCRKWLKMYKDSRKRLKVFEVTHRNPKMAEDSQTLHCRKQTKMAKYSWRFLKRPDNAQMKILEDTYRSQRYNMQRIFDVLGVIEELVTVANVSKLNSLIQSWLYVWILVSMLIIVFKNQK
jgi:hypothetical protein